MSLFLLSILCASVTNAFAPTSIITELDNVFAPLSNLRPYLGLPVRKPERIITL